MTEEQIALARRAIACQGWKWMPGMLGWRLNNNGIPYSIRFVKGVESMEALAGVGTGPLVASGYATCDGYWKPDDVIPDLTDPATLGCLLAMVRDAWDDECLCILPVDYGPGGVRWACRLTATGTFCTGQFWPTEIGSLVNALEAGHKRGEHIGAAGGGAR